MVPCGLSVGPTLLAAAWRDRGREWPISADGVGGDQWCAAVEAGLHGVRHAVAEDAEDAEDAVGAVVIAVPDAWRSTPAPAATTLAEVVAEVLGTDEVRLVGASQAADSRDALELAKGALQIARNAPDPVPRYPFPLTSLVGTEQRGVNERVTLVPAATLEIGGIVPHPLIDPEGRRLLAWIRDGGCMDLPGVDVERDGEPELVWRPTPGELAVGDYTVALHLDPQRCFRLVLRSLDRAEAEPTVVLGAQLPAIDVAPVTEYVRSWGIPTRADAVLVLRRIDEVWEAMAAGRAEPKRAKDTGLDPENMSLTRVDLFFMRHDFVASGSTGKSWEWQGGEIWRGFRAALEEALPSFAKPGKDRRYGQRELRRLYRDLRRLAAPEPLGLPGSSRTAVHAWRQAGYLRMGGAAMHAEDA
jgi:hypothetical protein